MARRAAATVAGGGSRKQAGGQECCHHGSWKKLAGGLGVPLLLWGGERSGPVVGSGPAAAVWKGKKQEDCWESNGAETVMGFLTVSLVNRFY